MFLFLNLLFNLIPKNFKLKFSVFKTKYIKFYIIIIYLIENYYKYKIYNK